MSRQLVKIATTRPTGRAGREAHRRRFDSEVFLLFPDPVSHGPVTLVPPLRRFPGTPLTDHDLGVAQWVFDNGERAGRGTDTLPSAASLFVPLHARRLDCRHPGRAAATSAPRITVSAPIRLRLLETFAGQMALAEERIRSADDAQTGAGYRPRPKRLRNSLLSAVSHDLRTPLAAIAGASSTLGCRWPARRRPTGTNWPNRFSRNPAA